MISAQEEDMVRIEDLEREEQHHGLRALIGTVHVIAEEKVFVVRNLSTNLEQRK